MVDPPGVITVVKAVSSAVCTANALTPTWSYNRNRQINQMMFVYTFCQSLVYPVGPTIKQPAKKAADRVVYWLLSLSARCSYVLSSLM